MSEVLTPQYARFLESEVQPRHIPAVLARTHDRITQEYDLPDSIFMASSLLLGQYTIQRGVEEVLGECILPEELANKGLQLSKDDLNFLLDVLSDEVKISAAEVYLKPKYRGGHSVFETDTRPMDSMSIYRRQLPPFEEMDPEHERELAYKIRDQLSEVRGEDKSALLLEGEAKAAFLELVESNVRLAVYWAERMRFQGNLELNDLVQWGNVGLVNAALRYDPDKGARFATYATSYIRWTMLRYLDSSRWNLDRPKNDLYPVMQVNEFYRSFIAQHGSEPAPADYDKEKISGNDVKAHQDYLRFRNLIQIQDMSLSGDYPSERDDYDRINLQNDPPKLSRDLSYTHRFNELTYGALQQNIKDLLEVYLTDREAEIVRLRYGFIPGQDPMTLNEIGTEMGLSRARIGQVESKYLFKLRHYLGDIEDVATWLDED